MKNLFYLFVVIIFFQNSYSQKKYDWKNIQKVELYSFYKSRGKEISSKDLNEKTFVKCKTDKIIKRLQELKKYEYDVLIEEKCYAVRVYFPKSHKDFFIFPDQGVMFNQNEYFRIAKSGEFENLIKLDK